MDLTSPHLPYVLSSYLLTFVVLAVLIVWHVVKTRARKRQLTVLDDDGAPRRPVQEVKSKA